MDFNYPKKIRFDCIYCGVCCCNTMSKNRHILMLKHEVNQISSKLNKKISDFAVESIGNDSYLFEMKKNDGKCIFLDQYNKCSIYLLRPLICKFYPFELINQKNEEFKFKVTYECPGIGLGKVLRKEYFIDLFNQAKIIFKNDKSKNCLENKI